MSEKRPQKRASHSQAIDINDLLRKVCKTVDKMAVYDEGWSDERVATELGLGENSVSNIRTEKFGPLRRRDVEAAQVDTIKNMSYMLASAIGEIQDLRRRVDALENARGNVQQFLPLQAMGK